MTSVSIQQSNQTTTSLSYFTFQPRVGSLVDVESRTWPGINKQGGVGRVTKVHLWNDVVTHIDVKYIVNGGSEKQVEIDFVKEHVDNSSINEDNDADNNNNKPGQRLSKRSKRDTNSKSDPSFNITSKDDVKKKSEKRSTSKTKINASSLQINDDNNQTTSDDYKMIIDVIEDDAPKKTKTKSKTKRKSVQQERSQLPSMKLPTVSPASPLMDESKKFDSTAEKDILHLENNVNSPIIDTSLHQKTTNYSNESERTVPSLPSPIQLNVDTSELGSTSANCASHPSHDDKLQSLLSVTSSTNTKSNNVLKKVYQGMTTSATSFVKNLLTHADEGANATMKETTNLSSSPESCKSLEISRDFERENLFTSLLNGVMKRNNSESMSIDDLLKEINAMIVQKNHGTKLFTELEMKTFLRILEEQNRIMMVWETRELYLV